VRQNLNQIPFTDQSNDALETDPSLPNQPRILLGIEEEFNIIVQTLNLWQCVPIVNSALPLIHHHFPALHHPAYLRNHHVDIGQRIALHRHDIC
jgi:hypothetical protein